MQDASFPFDVVTQWLRERSVPFALLQEGLRFPLPSEQAKKPYGSAGAKVICAWGETSADHFRGVATPSSVRITGAPRYDEVVTTNWEPMAADLRKTHDLRSPLLGMLPNPIEWQGFCSLDQKVALVRDFLSGAAQFARRTGGNVAVKPHPGESTEVYRRIVEEERLGDYVRVIPAAPLYPMLAACDAVITLSSTVSLEALLFRRSLGVLPVPGWGYVHDFVSSGAALGLRTESLPSDLEVLIGSNSTEAADEYVHRNLAFVGHAGEKVGLLLGDL